MYILKFESFFIEPSEEVLNYLKSNFPYRKVNIYEDKEEIFISVGDKSYYLNGNKKRLTNKIFYMIESEFPKIDTSILRKTIKEYLDKILNS